jgi:hypothetical protein
VAVTVPRLGLVSKTMVSAGTFSTVRAPQAPLCAFPWTLRRRRFPSLPRLHRLPFAVAVTVPRLGLVSKTMVSAGTFSTVRAPQAPLCAFPWTLRRRRLPSLPRLHQLPFAMAVTAPRPGLVSKTMVSAGTLSMMRAPQAPLLARVRSIGVEHG